MTLEGLNFAVVPQITSLCSGITKMFQNRIEMETIIDVVNGFWIDDDMYKGWNETLNKIFKGEYSRNCTYITDEDYLKEEEELQ